MNQVLVIFNQEFGDSECIIHFTLSEKREGADNSRAAFPGVLRASQLVQNLAWFIKIKKVFANHLVSSKINQVPVIDSIVAPQVQIVEFLVFSSL